MCFAIFITLAANSTELKIAVYDFEPRQIIGGNEPQGIDIVFMNKLASLSGVKANYIVCPFARCLRQLEKGEIDLIINLYKTQERLRYLTYLKHEYIAGGYRTFYVHSDSNIVINNYHDLKGRLIGQLKGAKYFERFDNDTKLQKSSYVHQEQLISMLAKQRLDTVIGKEITLDYLIQKRKLQKVLLKSKYKEFISKPGFIAMSKTSAHLNILPTLEVNLSKLMDEGFLEKILATY